MRQPQQLRFSLRLIGATNGFGRRSPSASRSRGGHLRTTPRRFHSRDIGVLPSIRGLAKLGLWHTFLLDVKFRLRERRVEA